MQQVLARNRGSRLRDESVTRQMFIRLNYGAVRQTEGHRKTDVCKTKLRCGQADRTLIGRQTDR